MEMLSKPKKIREQCTCREAFVISTLSKNSDYLCFDKVIVLLKDSLNLYHLGSISCTQVGTSFHNLS